MGVCGGGRCCCRAVERAVSASRSGVTVGYSAVGLMVTPGLCRTVAGGSMSASPLLVVVVVVGSPAVGPCREPCSVVAGWLWGGLCRSHCYCRAASAPLSHSHQAALPHSFLPAPPVFTLDQSGGRSLLHLGHSPSSPPPHSRGVQFRQTWGHCPPCGHQTLTIPLPKQCSPESHSRALCPTAVSSMGTPTSCPLPPPPSLRYPGGRKPGERASLCCCYPCMTPPQVLTATWGHSKALPALEKKDLGDGRHL